MLHEIRYGRPRSSTDIAVEVVNPTALERSDGVRLNLGCGHIPLDEYVNVDMRKLPGVDVVAPLDAMPFDTESVREVFSAHVLEHFPQAELERQLLPYWFSLLAPGGVFRCVVPDVDAMIDQYREGTISFENLREVVYGGQEYEGDFHHTAFTPESLSRLLVDAGFDDVELIERGRQNGACLEFELAARRPA
jgi:predicted SAM-dependent methyltransferase